MEYGFHICEMDNSSEMLAQLTKKTPPAKIILCDALEYRSAEQFVYILVTSGSASLFTDVDICKNFLANLKTMLKEMGYPGICSRYRCRPLPGFGYLSNFCYAYHYGWCPVDTPLKKLL
jgi:hypothetical protein